MTQSPLCFFPFNKFLLFTLTAGAAPTLAPAVSAQIPPLDEAPIFQAGGLPYVEATASGNAHLAMLFDTGNEDSVLDLAKAKELKLDLLPIMGPDGKPYPGYSSAVLKSVHVGNADLGDINVLVADLQPDITKGVFPKSDGTLAYTAFKNRIVRLDYKKRSVGISGKLATDADASAGAGMLSYPTFGKRGPHIVTTTGFQVNGQSITAQIDTLYSGSVLIYPTSVDKLSLKNQAESTKSEFFPYTDGGVQMTTSVAATEGFGGKPLLQNAPLYFATPKVHLPDGLFDGTVGDALFEGRVLTFDFHGQHFWIE